MKLFISNGKFALNTSRKIQAVVIGTIVKYRFLSEVSLLATFHVANNETFHANTTCRERRPHEQP